MTYDPTEPQQDEGYLTGQQVILENFSQADTVFGVDHVAFSANDADNGKHDTMRLVERNSAPTTEEDEGALYCIDDPSIGLTACIRDEENGASICVGGGSVTAAYPQPVVAVLFDATGVTAGAPTNVASVGVVGVNPATITVTFTAPIAANAMFQLGVVAGLVPNIVNPQVSVLNTTQCVIIFTPSPPGLTLWSQMSLLIWDVQ